MKVNGSPDPQGLKRKSDGINLVLSHLLVISLRERQRAKKTKRGPRTWISDLKKTSHHFMSIRKNNNNNHRINAAQVQSMHKHGCLLLFRGYYLSQLKGRGFKEGSLICGASDLGCPIQRTDFQHVLLFEGEVSFKVLCTGHANIKAFITLESGGET